MRAIAVDELQGEPHLIELPEPQPKPDQLLVRVSAAAINPFDWKLADGFLGDAVPNVLPFVLGLDAAGTVVGVGEHVTRFKVGDRVFGQFFHTPLGEGTYAEFTVVSETGAVTALPATVSDETAAALPTAGMTAMALIEALDLPAGASLLIVGAAGGVGSFATQLAAGVGLRVLVTAGATDDERMRRLGASETFDPAHDVAAHVRHGHPHGVDGLLDLVSDAEGFSDMAGLVRAGGRALSTLGVADENALEAQGFQGSNFELQANSSLLQSLAETVESGRLAVPIEHVISLEDVPSAIARSRAGDSHGKTVIRIAAAVPASSEGDGR